MMRLRNSHFLTFLSPALLLTAGLLISGCKKEEKSDVATPQLPVTTAGDMADFTVDKPELYPLVAAEPYTARAELNVTGTVNPDIAREIPVISLASGRVVDIKARLDDYVKKGQLLLKVQSPDSTAAFDTYKKAVNDERMNNLQYARSQDLYAHGAISKAMLEQAEDAEKDALADLKAAEETLETIGVDKDHPSPVVPVYAPISGVIIQQNVTQAAAAGVAFSGSATAFTIADLSSVWVICDVFEQDIPKIALGQEAKIKLNAYPDKVFIGHVSDIGPVLDPQIRTAKVRVEVPNPGVFKVGMFVTATLASRQEQRFAQVPASSVLHLHDRDWVFEPAPGSKFRRVEVKAGEISNGKQVILSGVQSGQQVISNVLQLETTLENQ
jgi:cobalt-zinc-cadmium efflux system membrane fusion protein